MTRVMYLAKWPNYFGKILHHVLPHFSSLHQMNPFWWNYLSINFKISARFARSFLNRVWDFILKYINFGVLKLFLIVNDRKFWAVSHKITPFSLAHTERPFFSNFYTDRPLPTFGWHRYVNFIFECPPWGAGLFWAFWPFRHFGQNNLALARN